MVISGKCILSYIVYDIIEKGRIGKAEFCVTMWRFGFGMLVVVLMLSKGMGTAGANRINDGYPTES